MKSQDPVRTGFPAHDELPLSSLSAQAHAGAPIEETVKLKTENFRLQRLVAELLIENQQLRQRYCGPPADPRHADASTGRRGDHHDQ